MKSEVVIVIPAYNPDNNLIKIVEDLKKNMFYNIIVVNDGSTTSQIFKEIKDVIILNHTINRGKGEALKTAFNYIRNSNEKIIGVITVDADGQHCIDDINKVYREFEENQDSVILGSREFCDKEMPWKSKVGNKIINILFSKNTGRKLKDTQTGLRAIPYKYLPEIADVRGSRYEYETNVLMYCIEKNIKIREINILSIYINNNKKSSFRAISDSIKIAKSLYEKQY